MKFAVITTPVHDAIGITHELPATIESEVARIVELRFDSFIKDVDALAVALYASHPSACAELLSLPPHDLRRLAAENAKAMHFNPCCIAPLAATGYFCDQLHKLLRIGWEAPDYGAKLVQVFLTMLDHIEEHHLNDDLVEDLQRFVAMRDFSDGYLLIEQADEDCLVMPSLWRR